MASLCGESARRSRFSLIYYIRCGVLCQYPYMRILVSMQIPTVSPISVTLRNAREAAGLTQVQLAEKADVRQASISELETGKTRRVDLDVLDRLCGALGVQPGDLLERRPKKSGRS